MQWSFNFEGTVKDLNTVLKDTVMPNEAMTQFKIVSALIKSEAQMCEARGLNVRVHAYGNEAVESNHVRTLFLDVKGIGTPVVDETKTT